MAVGLSKLPLPSTQFDVQLGRLSGRDESTRKSASSTRSIPGWMEDDVKIVLSLHQFICYIYVTNILVQDYAVTKR